MLETWNRFTISLLIFMATLPDQFRRHRIASRKILICGGNELP